MSTTTKPHVRPYGLWESPISADLLSGSNISMREVVANQSAKTLYYIESRPAEDGRCCIVEHSVRGNRDILPAAYSARAEVHDLGGAAVSISLPGGDLIFTDWSTKNVFSLDPNSRQVSLLLEAEDGIRFADFDVHPKTPQWILAIKEDHRNATPETQAEGVVNTLVVMNTANRTAHTIVQGDHFYSHPRFSKDGGKVTWIQWSHPDMPWTGTVLYTADWDSGTVRKVTRIAGEARLESISQPRWGPDGTLFFVSDQSGYWQLFCLEKGASKARAIQLKGLESAEFSAPEWTLGLSTYAILDANTIVAACIENAISRIIRIDVKTGAFEDLQLPFVDIGQRDTGIFGVSETAFAVIGSTALTPKELCVVDIASLPARTTIKSSLEIEFPASLYSKAVHRSVPRVYGAEKSGLVHMGFAPPQNPEYQAPAGTLPPLLVFLHGGPNSCTTPALSIMNQYWTSRGYALAYVNYSGSTGYGRQYRERLTGNWGVYDVEDTASCVAHLVSTSQVDPTRVGIFGGSAGGYATLQALHMYPEMWAAGVSLYGISDLKALQADSYKFESHDVERLMLGGGTDEAERENILWTRSPCYHADKITAPLLLLQGSVDTAVPPEQSKRMAKVMEERGAICKVVIFEGEGHGFLMRANVREALNQQDQWWRQYLVRDGV